ncbi:HTH-type transcriptional repressor of iron proteins A [Vibrio aerogenes CECT 7868]|uniref:HTH-type transcriptional repressor of iron proteins A n=1 Tax=Vibrio aerogenes CECT 7868 TaxID=1216006 RepID=A0A1M5ZT97_9VIBR|nr:helix-turn-helix transcriptional regulator [Vibrio aerogenes]SHI27480.1 HTH-type transcriptional repressor of iron proteins A [Vibrio aerogenes CECT 7868]
MSEEKLRQAQSDTTEPFILVICDEKPVERSSGLHKHARGQLSGLRKGVFTLGTETGTWIVPAEHAIWMPPGVPHFGYSHGAVESWSCYVSGPACTDLPRQPCLVKITRLLREAVMRASDWQGETLSERELRIAMVILDELCVAPVEPFGLTMPKDPRLIRVARALLRDPGNKQSLQQWADWSGISNRSLSRKFVAETGYTFTAWRQRARLIRALELLAEGRQVTVVAFELGYDSVSAFISVFRQVLGTTPTHYFSHQ